MNNLDETWNEAAISAGEGYRLREVGFIDGAALFQHKALIQLEKEYAKGIHPDYLYALELAIDLIKDLKADNEQA